VDDKFQALNGFALVDIDDVWPTLGDLPPDADAALHRCRAGEALCFRGPAGVFVLTLRPGENRGQLEAFVLLAVASRFGAFAEAEPAVLAIARDLTAATVAFRSVRKGWARRLGPAWRPRGKREFWRYTWATPTT
jgi:hypothetical protein